MPALQALIAEVTHRCPLHCVYCSNPLAMRDTAEELTTEQWTAVFRDAAQLGALQLHLTGGEPLARPDLTALIAAARSSKLYVNLITSGVGLNDARLDELVGAGLDHLQLSFQDSTERTADLYAGTRAHALKLRLSAMIRRHRIGFTVNMVVHRDNIGRLPEMIALAEELGPQRLEIANVQYYGWAFENRAALLPTREQVRESIALVEEAQQRLAGRMRIEFVLPDYYARYPKPCMGGWGNHLLLIDPAGYALPCHAARVIPDLVFERVVDRPLESIWRDSAVFNRFRGEEWMQEPCRSCDRRHLDFGGCRCQAMMLASDANATDPACTLSPRHSVVEQVLQETQRERPAPLVAKDLVFRIQRSAP
jgi:pyrroloquinoline quinone biosynthesis protein E